MKKQVLSILLGMSSIALFAQSDKVVIEDFDQNRDMNLWTSEDNGGAYFESYTSDPGSLQNTVGRYVLSQFAIDNGGNFVGSLNSSWSSFDIDNYAYLSVAVYSDTAFRLDVKVEEDAGDFKGDELAIDYASYDAIGTWDTLYFDLSAASNSGIKYALIWLFENYEDASTVTLYLDNITLHKTDPTGISEDKISTNTKMFPNPTSGNVNLISEMTGNKNVSVYDNMGNIVLETVIDGNSLDISSLVDGTYTVHVSNTTEFSVVRLVVTK